MLSSIIGYRITTYRVATILKDIYLSKKATNRDVCQRNVLNTKIKH